MENSIKKKRFFWEEILEMIPCGVSLRTFSPEQKEKTEIERVFSIAEASLAFKQSVQRMPHKQRSSFK